MIYKSKTHPQFDMIIDYVNYYFDENGNIEPHGTFASWCNINREAFTKFTDNKLGKERTKKSTFPYAFYGDGKLSSITRRIKNYNLEYQGLSDDEVVIYCDDEWEYSSGFKEGYSKLSK